MHSPSEPYRPCVWPVGEILPKNKVRHLPQNERITKKCNGKIDRLLLSNLLNNQ